MTGSLILKDNPAEDLEAATKQYVDNHTSGVLLYTPQNLTDGQKTQARGNIGAAPDGFGLGNVAGIPIPPTIAGGLNTATQNGWYYFGGAGGVQNSPPLISTSDYGYLLVSSRDENTKLQVFMPEVNNYIAVRKLEAGVWQPWEYVNPPMESGVEYRTTERFWGRPVYYKIVDCGQIADNKQVEHGVANMRDCIFCQGLRGAMPMPSISNNDLSDPWSYYVADVNRTKITLACGATAAGGNCHVILKYTKTTD